MLNNENDEDLLNFDEPLDMTDPNRPIQNNTFNGSVYDRRRMYDDTPKVQKIKTPIIQRITGFLVIIAMLIAVAFLGYMASKGNFDVDKELSLFKSVGILVYGVLSLMINSNASTRSSTKRYIVWTVSLSSSFDFART